ncbi:MAG TPA: MraY family glycosyltransferase [Gammaproteobacteria bacterium]|nr:MraY family glycosyltransferase [Gammaproteobacteria bacterium]
MTVVTSFLSFIVTIVFMFALRPVAVAVGLVDIPGGRKRHDVPVPIIGGVAMSIGLGIGTSLIEHPEFWNPTLLGVYLLVVVGTIDDRFDLPANVRLIAQSCAALLVVLASNVMVSDIGAPLFFGVSLGPLGLPFTVLFVMTLVNAFNLIDGIDGLAGGLALLSLLAMTIIGFGTPSFALASIAAAVVAGYLLFNLPLGFNKPVRAFMGDAGSTSLGLVIAALGVYLSQAPVARISPVIGLWLVAVPVFDLFSTILRRLVEGKSPLAPDHEHLHHVLVEHGLSRRATLACMLTLASVFAAVGITADIVVIPDGVMLVLWLAGGALYYQMMRHPKMVVDVVRIALPAGQPRRALPPVLPRDSESRQD